MDTLRVFDPHGFAPAKIGQEPEPVPLTYELIEQQTPDGVHTDHVRVWWNRDGVRCQICPEDECNFRPGEQGVGTCVKRRSGGIPFRFAILG
jgi:hypothetical protein